MKEKKHKNKQDEKSVVLPPSFYSLSHNRQAVLLRRRAHRQQQAAFHPPPTLANSMPRNDLPTPYQTDKRQTVLNISLAEPSPKKHTHTHTHNSKANPSASQAEREHAHTRTPPLEGEDCPTLLGVQRGSERRTAREGRNSRHWLIILTVAIRSLLPGAGSASLRRKESNARTHKHLGIRAPCTLSDGGAREDTALCGWK